MAVRRSSLIHQSRSRRKTSWGAGPRTLGAVGGAQAAISTTSAVLATTGVVLLGDGNTLVRTRGELTAWLTSVNAASTGFSCAFGIGIVRSPAFVAGVGSCPTPMAEESSELWLYHRYFMLTAGAAIGAAVAADNDFVNVVTAGVRFEVDSKAMRKLDEDDTIYACLEVQLTGTAVMNWAFNSRTLFKLA